MKKIKITEVSKFSIWPHTQNRKFENCGNFSLTSNFDTASNFRFKTSKKKNKLRQKLNCYDML